MKFTVKKLPDVLRPQRAITSPYYLFIYMRDNISEPFIESKRSNSMGSEELLTGQPEVKRTFYPPKTTALTLLILHHQQVLPF